jgi:hypothetical protein
MNPALKPTFPEKQLGTAYPSESLETWGKLGKLGKKWIENWLNAKYPHCTGVCLVGVCPSKSLNS